MIEVRSLRRLLTSFRASLRGVRSTPLVFVASVCTMGAGLLLLGLFLLVVHNMQGMLEHLSRDLRVTAYLTEGPEPEPPELQRLAERLAALHGVASVTYVSPQHALERLRVDLGEDADVLDGLSRNPLPGAFELEIAGDRPAHELVPALAERIERETAVAEVRYGEGWLEGYARVLRAIEWGGLGLGAFLFLVLGTIVAATVRLAVYARSDEIQIQRLVGAGGLYVRLPFYLEGALEGGLAALLALGLLRGLYDLGLPLLRSPLAFVLGRAEPAFLGGLEASLLLAVGMGLGLCGAVVSLISLEEAP